VSRVLNAGTYLALLLFGFGQGVLGAFCYGAGPAPLLSLAFGFLLLATCAFGGWGTGKALGALAPAAGWFAAVLVLASGTSGGSVVITATEAGELFLFGGAVCAIVGLLAGLFLGPGRSGPGGLRSR
jgi:Family of unknown function (DUF6113)